MTPTSTSAWALAWRQTVRDARAGELRLLIVAVMLAVAALTAVGFFADRLHAGLQRDARALLGGDAMVASDHATPASLVEQARRQGLAISLAICQRFFSPRVAAARVPTPRLAA